MSENQNNRRFPRQFVPGCPLWVEWDEFDGSWKVCLRNVGWCEVKEATLVADGQEYTGGITLVPGAVAAVRFSEVTAQPQEYYIGAVTSTDGVTWENTVGMGERIAPGAPVDTGAAHYDEFQKAWADQSPLVQPEFTDTYWRCGCGQINDIARTFCGKCQRERTWVRAHRDGVITRKTNQSKAVAEQQLALAQQQAEQERKARRRRISRLFGAAMGGVLLITAVILFITGYFLPSRTYAQAQGYLKLDRYYEAYDKLQSLGGFRDSEQLMLEISRTLSSETAISGGYRHLIKNNRLGKVVGVGYALDGALMTDKWNAIRAVSAGKDHSVGLHYSGTLMAVGNDKTGACDIVNWLDIVEVDAGNGFTVGRKADGTVQAVGTNDHSQCDLRSWSGIVSVAVGEDFVLGLKEDGTVVAAGNNKYGQCNVSAWSDIVYICAGNSHALGVKADGTVVATGRNENQACDVSEWTDVIAVTAGDEFTVGLKNDGTLIATGKNDKGQLEIGAEKDAIAVVSGWDFTVVIRSNGVPKFIGTNEDGEGDIAAWSLRT